MAIDEKNFQTFSLELLKIYLSICSEVDVVARLLSKKIDLKTFPEKTENDTRHRNIATYRDIIYSHYPDISGATIGVKPGIISTIPWSSFEEEKSPDWWQQYNEVKHTRDEFFHQANLKNTIYSLSGLLVLLNYYCHPMNHDNACISLDDTTTPKLLEIKGDHFVEGVSWEGPRVYLPNQSILKRRK